AVAAGPEPPSNLMAVDGDGKAAEARASVAGDAYVEASGVVLEPDRGALSGHDQQRRRIAQRGTDPADACAGRRDADRAGGQHGPRRRFKAPVWRPPGSRGQGWARSGRLRPLRVPECHAGVVLLPAVVFAAVLQRGAQLLPERDCVIQVEAIGRDLGPALLPAQPHRAMQRLGDRTVLEVPATVEV